jgi:hypothetical protein
MRGLKAKLCGWLELRFASGDTPEYVRVLAQPFGDRTLRYSNLLASV